MLEHKIQPISASGSLNDFKAIRFYLKQCEYIVDGGVQTIDSVVIGSLDKSSNLAKDFLCEIRKAPKEILDLVIEQCVINRRIWMLNNPIKARISDIKMIFMCSILRILHAILKILKPGINEKETDIPDRGKDRIDNAFYVQMKKTGAITV